MIYGSMILESNFNKLIDPIETIHEYYKNEISLLNECIYSFNEDGNSLITVGDQEDNQTSNKTKSGFLKNIIERLKEILKKFIEWCRKIYNTIKNFIYKDSDGIKKDLAKVVKNIEKATTINELKSYGTQIGIVRNSYIVLFEVDNFVKDLNDNFKFLLDRLIEINNNISRYIEILSNDGKLSESIIDEIEEIVNNLKTKLTDTKLYKINKDKYYKTYVYISSDNKMTVENIKQAMINMGKTAYSSIDYIDKEIKSATENIKTLENNASKKIQELDKMTKNDIAVDRESIDSISKLINATSSAAKQISQLRIKKLNSVKNIYRFGTDNAYMLKILKG